MKPPSSRFFHYTAFFWLGAVAAGLICWSLLVPWAFSLEQPLATRVRLYGLLIAPLLPLLALHMQLQFRSVQRLLPRLQSGALGPEQLQHFLRRLVGYPLRFSLIFLLGGMFLAAVAATIQSRRHSTPAPVCLALLLAALAHLAPLSVLGYYLTRRAVERFLRLPPTYTGQRESSPGLIARCLPGLLTGALAAWLMGAGQLLLLHFRASGSSAQAWPALLGAAAGLGWCLVLATLQLKRLQARARNIMDQLEILARSREPGFGGGFILESCDELARLEEAFNLVYQAIGRQAIELRSAALDAHEAQKRHLELIGVVCHNLRTPIHSIVGFSQLLLDDEKSLNQEQRGFVSSILRSSHHLLGLVDDVVDLSKMESGVLGVDLTRVDGRKVVQEAVEAGKLLAGGKLDLAAHLPVDLPELRADETRLRQILLNLISNAVKYAGRGKVLVTVRQENNMVRFTVEDEGPGLPQEYLERIFQEYERAATGDSTSGTGLGLAITRRLVEMHGGQITAYNRPQGGAGFSFTIPRWKNLEAAR
jgi:signal transduction histidine kinase